MTRKSKKKHKKLSKQPMPDGIDVCNEQQQYLLSNENVEHKKSKHRQHHKKHSKRHKGKHKHKQSVPEKPVDAVPNPEPISQPEAELKVETESEQEAAAIEVLADEPEAE